MKRRLEDKHEETVGLGWGEVVGRVERNCGSGGSGGRG